MEQTIRDVDNAIDDIRTERNNDEELVMQKPAVHTVGYVFSCSIGIFLGLWLATPEEYSVDYNINARTGDHVEIEDTDNAEFTSTDVSAPFNLAASKDDENKSSIVSAGNVNKELFSLSTDKDLSSSEPEEVPQKSGEENIQSIFVLLDQLDSTDNFDELYNQLTQQITHLTQTTPELIDELLLSYSNLSEGDKKEQLGFLLAATENSVIELNIIEKLESGDNRSEWLGLLRNIGVNSSESRDRLFERMKNSVEAENISSGLLALNVQIVSPEEREIILNEIASYTDHPDDQVKASAIEVLSEWAGNDQLHILENAFQEPSVAVREAALSAATSRNVQSEKIKSSLLSIVNNSNEQWQFRVDAYQALTSYPLDGEDYADFYRFHTQHKSKIGESES